MAHIFISYARQTKAITKALVEDVEALGHTVWFDQELSGGQAWWDQILSAIRRCDLFVFVLDPAALNSVACKREYGYAADLRKPILPILASEGVSTNLLPPSLSQIEFVDYRKQDRTAALRLARAFSAVPPSAPLPDPLPVPPEAPISYLGSLAAKVDATAILTYEEQSVMVFDLKRGLRDPETADDTRTLLKMFRKRRDLFAGIAEEIDQLFDGLGETSARSAPLKFQETKAQFNRDLLIFVAKWTLACLLGEVGGNEVGSYAVLRLGPRTFVFVALLYGVAIGVAVGFTQWVLLRRRIDYSQWWILMTTIGWATAVFASSLSVLHTRVAVGTMQWLILRRSVSRAAWWILIVTIGGAFGFAAAELMGAGMDGGTVTGASPLSRAISGALNGVITGFCLGILLQHSGRGLRA